MTFAFYNSLSLFSPTIRALCPSPIPTRDCCVGAPMWLSPRVSPYYSIGNPFSISCVSVHILSRYRSSTAAQILLSVYFFLPYWSRRIYPTVPSDI
ncbi:hypothetical protein EDD17DRAFT_436347 [Pisolithus thermaeus]|nr:hypothetical protein EV401DRAFT_119531 [Pisolithus croceorrhizus]KAI6163791.1 hypothetical protein EDD17DRAFT_436347 [Pisolithus thermaeus]